MHFSQPLALLVNSDCPYPIIFFFHLGREYKKLSVGSVNILLMLLNMCLCVYIYITAIL